METFVCRNWQLGDPKLHTPEPIFTVKERILKNGKREFEEDKMLRNGFWNEGEGWGSRVCKINRIPLLCTAYVNVVNVYSPSLIFVRIVNHIRDQLVLREPCNLSPLHSDELKKGYYVLCPIEERAYGRARIIKVEFRSTKTLVQLILIDDGIFVWADSSSLASMDPQHSPGAKDLAYHPWQVQTITLVGLSPLKTPKNRDCMWTEKVRRRLKILIKQFDLFKVKGTTLSRVINDYNVTTVVSLYGIEKGTESMSEKRHDEPANEFDISRYLASAVPGETVPMVEFDGLKQARFENLLSEKEKLESESKEHVVPDWCKQPIPGWYKDDRDGKPMPSDWQRPLEDVQIADMTAEWLRENNYVYGGRVFMTMETDYTQSPWEFYGRPMRMTADEGDERQARAKAIAAARAKEYSYAYPDDEMKWLSLVDIKEKDEGDLIDPVEAILRGCDVVKEHAAVLTAFYSRERNRRQVNKADIDRVLANPSVRGAYAMWEARGDRAEYMGRWQRVEILEVKDPSVIIRFVDSGGTDMVPGVGLYHIHPDHTAWPALCSQFCVHGWQLDGGREGESWSAGGAAEGKMASMTKFLRVTHHDVPMCMRVLPDAAIPREAFKHRREAWERKGVVFVSDLKGYCTEKNVVAMEEMAKAGMAKMNANAPFSLKLLNNK